jgi:hypothetical protein
MANHAKINVSFELERRGEVIYFRATHKPDAVWHGPYSDLAEVTATIAHYISEDVIDEWFVLTPEIVDEVRQAIDTKT